jgi:hypothetical protein
MGERLAKQRRTLEQWKAVLSKDLLALRQLTGQDALLHSMNEQAIGQHCCFSQAMRNELLTCSEQG